MMDNKLSRKGLLVAGGTGSRMFPITKSVSKHLLPVYNKPLAYYGISLLMLAGIREIGIIHDPKYQQDYNRLVYELNGLGVDFTLISQATPLGIPSCIVEAEDFLCDCPFAMVLADNIFHGNDLIQVLTKASINHTTNTCFVKQVKDPSRFGVYDRRSNAVVEKPQEHISNEAVVGLYFFTQEAISIAKLLKPSARNETEIADLINRIIKNGDPVEFEVMSRGMGWFDAGTPNSLYEATGFVMAIENRQGGLICSPEEISHHNGWIEALKYQELVAGDPKSEYYENVRVALLKSSIE